MWLHVDHATAGDSCGGGDLKVLGLKDQVLLAAHLDNLPTHEAQLLVVVQHCVHVLDPDGIHGTIEDDPLAVVVCGRGLFTKGVGQHPV